MWFVRLADHFESNWDAKTIFCSPFPVHIPRFTDSLSVVIYGFCELADNCRPPV
jgi:hypothetical protein